MAVEDDILALLRGKKVKDQNGQWHIYDEFDNELTDPAGVKWKGIPGAILMWLVELGNYVMFARRRGRR